MGWIMSLNTEVKRPRADGTAARPRESRSPPGSFFYPSSPSMRGFLFDYPFSDVSCLKENSDEGIEFWRDPLGYRW